MCLFGAALAVVADSEEVEKLRESIVVTVAATNKGDVEERDNSVYVLKDDDGIVHYVGRTNSAQCRESEHKRDPKHQERSGYHLVIIFSGLTEREARAAEQLVISAYTISYLDNIRREIAIKRIDQQYTKYVEALCHIWAGTSLEAAIALMGE